jgi:hypothetical protein
MFLLFTSRAPRVLDCAHLPPSHQSPGQLGEHAYLPPLFGQIVAGVLLRNAPFHLNFGERIDVQTAVVLKKFAFVALLLKAGISMDVTTLKKAKCRFPKCVHSHYTSDLHSHCHCADILRNSDPNVDESRRVRLFMDGWNCARVGPVRVLAMCADSCSVQLRPPLSRR